MNNSTFQDSSLQNNRKRLEDMRKRVARIWGITVLFLLFIVSIAVTDLVVSHTESIQMAYDKANLSSHLVSEWISESLYHTQYILRDISLQVENDAELRKLEPMEFSTPFNQLLVERAQADDHLLILGVNSVEGVLANSSISSILGDSAKDLDREYFAKALEEPVDQFKIGNSFVSSTGKLNVTATYPVFSPEGEFIGFSMAGMDLSFFQRWLDRIEDPSVTITIIDSKQKILARKPLSDKIGNILQIEELDTFIASPKNVGNFRLLSPLDSADRLWSVRKIGDLPFLVAVGYAREQALTGWNQKFLIYTFAIIFISLISIEFVRKYLHNERLVEELQAALVEVKKLSGLLPICAKCKNIRDDQGYWKQIESYIHEHSEAEFSHSICPDCAKELYQDYKPKNDQV